MFRKISAFVLAFVLALSAVSCGKQADGGSDPAEETSVSSETEKSTTKKKKSSGDSEKDASETTTAKKKKKKTTTKEAGSEKTETKEKSTKTTKKAAESTKKTTEDPDLVEKIEDIEVTDEDTLGWTKEIVEKYESAATSEDFVKSLTFEEFLIVVKLPEETARKQYNALHGIKTEQPTTTTVQTTAETTTYSVTVTTKDPGTKIDTTEDAELRSVYNKFNVKLEDLLAITGLTKEEFFYVWNVEKDNTFRKNILNQLYGYNYYDSGTTDHPVVADKVDVMLIRAYWDDVGKLHLICSLNNGYSGVAYNIEVPDIELTDKFDRVIAKKNFGYVSQYVDTSKSEEIVGIGYGQPVLHEFVFEQSKISKPYADIRGVSGVKMVVTCNCDVYGGN